MKDFFNKNKILLGVAAVIIVGGGIWLATKGSSDGTTSTKSSSALSKEVQAKCMADVNDDLFCNFAAHFANAGDYKTTVSGNDQSGSSVLELANDSKGNSSMVVKQNEKEQANIVVYNGITYSKDYSDGQWFKYPASSTSKPETLDLKKEFTKGDFKGDNGQKLEYKKISTEKCGNLTCYKYQIVDPEKPGEQAFLWFDTKDYLLRSLSAKNETSDTEMNVTYTSVRITEPSPAKDAPSSL